MNSIAVIVINFNDIKETTQCLASLSRQKGVKLDLILVENGSVEPQTEDQLKILANTYKSQLTIIKNQTNLGFTGGANTGIRHVLARNYEYFALFNNDAVADQYWLKNLYSASQTEASGITTGLLLHEDGKTIDSTGDWCSTWGLPFPRSRNLPVAQAPKSGFVFSGSGGASLYSVKLIEQIGMFDENFFAYYEDTDLSFRAQLGGFKVFYTNQAIAYHKRGKTSARIPGIAVLGTFKNLPMFFVKNIPTRLLVSTGWRFFLAYHLMLFNAIRKGNAAPALKGWGQSLLLFWTHSLRQRRSIQSNRKVSTEYIKSMLYPDLPPDQTGLRKLRQFFTHKP